MKASIILILSLITITTTLVAQSTSLPKATFAGMVQGEMEKDSLLLHTTLELSDAQFTIESYYLSVHSGGVVSERKNFGSKIDSSYLGKYDKLKSSDKVYFDRIKATGPDGVSYQLNPISIRIK